MKLRQFAQERAVAAAEIDLQRRDASEDREQVERRDICLRDQFDHGMKMQPLRGDSTSQRLKLNRRTVTRLALGFRNQSRASPPRARRAARCLRDYWTSFQTTSR